MRYLLFYEKIADYAEAQKPYAAAHLDYFERRAIKDQILLAGSLEDPVDGAAVILFEAESATIVAAFAKSDPYVIHGIVNRWWVRQWDVVLGSQV